MMIFEGEFDVQRLICFLIIFVFGMINFKYYVVDLYFVSFF